MKLDTARFAWREITGPAESSYPIHHELCILGYDRDAGTIDLLIRFDDKGGHCQAHRHVTTTSVLVLEGEQHLYEIVDDDGNVTSTVTIDSLVAMWEGGR